MERAASECGIDIEAARLLVEQNRENQAFDNDGLRVTAAEMLHHGVKTLIALTKIRDGRLGGDGSTENMGEFGGSTSWSKKWEHPDLPAAQALVTGALKIYALIDPKKRAGKDGPPGSDDLFDGPEGEKSDWSFRDKS